MRMLSRPMQHMQQGSSCRHALLQTLDVGLYCLCPIGLCAFKYILSVNINVQTGRRWDASNMCLQRQKRVVMRVRMSDCNSQPEHTPAAAGLQGGVHMQDGAGVSPSKKRCGWGCGDGKYVMSANLARRPNHMPAQRQGQMPQCLVFVNSILGHNRPHSSSSPTGWPHRSKQTKQNGKNVAVTSGTVTVQAPKVAMLLLIARHWQQP